MVLGVFFGSVSCEHDVSIVTALQAIQNIPQKKYEVAPVYVTRDGQWYTGDGLLNLATYKHPLSEGYDVERCVAMPHGTDRLALYRWPVRGGIFGGRAKPIRIIDVALPAFHGVNGEDGTMQGLFEMFNVPYTSSGVTGSAVGMDKAVMKSAFRGCGFPVLPYLWFTRSRYERDAGAILQAAERDIGYPMFVKPANLGSSIGISKASDRASLLEAIDVAAAYDRKIIIEKGLTDLTEVNCGAVGFDEDVTASLCETPVSWKEFLTFDDKYLSGGGKGMSAQKRKIPAPISAELTARIRQLTIDIFHNLDLKGVIRVDYMIDNQTGKLYVNEVNTIPGSLAYYLFEPMGMTYPQLIDKMIDSALKAHAEKAKNTFLFQSSLLDNATLSSIKGGKIGKK